MPSAHPIAFVAQHPVHYHTTIYRAAEADPDLDVDVLFMQALWAKGGWEPQFGKSVDWGVDMTSGYRSRIYRNISPNPDGEGFFKFINPGLIWRVLTGPYKTVYVHGFNHFSHVLTFLAARLSGKQLLLRSITYDWAVGIDGKPRSKAKAFLRKLIYTALCKLPTKILYIGQRNYEFFRTHGVPDRKLVHAPHLVDNAFFQDHARRLAPQKEAIKQSFGFRPDQKIITYCAKLIPHKQPHLLLDAFLKADLGPDWALLFVGTGESEASLKETAAAHSAHVTFTGFLDQNDICKAYSVTDVFVLPSWTETWGLVVNEALNFDCAVIAADQVACAPDLVEGKTGLVFPFTDEAALVAALKRFADDPAFLAQCQANARPVIDDCTAERLVGAIKAASGTNHDAPEGAWVRAVEKVPG